MYQMQKGCAGHLGMMSIATAVHADDGMDSILDMCGTAHTILEIGWWRTSLLFLTLIGALLERRHVLATKHARD